MSLYKEAWGLLKLKIERCETYHIGLDYVIALMDQALKQAQEARDKTQKELRGARNEVGK